MPHMLQRQLSRTLCDEYTNIFDDSLPSQSVPVLMSMSEMSSSSSSQCYPEEASFLLLPPSSVSLKAMETSSWSPRSSVTTPGYSPSSETDDSLVLDAMSSPTSPLFPVLLTSPVEVATATTSSLVGSVSCSPEILFAEDDDFFHNSFYRSLDQRYIQAHVPIHSTQKLAPLSLASTIISEEIQKSAVSKRALSLTTAAPSEIFSITMDELLLDPYQLSRTTTTASTTSQDTETAYPAMETETMASDLAMETEKMASFVATLTQLSDSNSNPDDLDLAFSETSTLSEVSDDSDGDYMASPVKNNNKRKLPSKATKRPREAKYKRSKSLVQKTPKVYPPRPPRNKMIASDTNMDVTETSLACTGSSGSSSSSSKSRHGQKSRTILPHPDGGFMCDQCPGERFGRVHDLKRHQDSKHFVMTWPCDFCHRPFVRRDALLRHYVVKSARHDGIHPTDEESHRLYEAKARAKARC
ncbi:hypothetical protein BGZ52_004340 [Haplosporangium bisporale]|nr:hypothetical protein BGZ52_004340 [Haplosporangium bisporale]KFH71154.1 hypothetical protein MVEG_04000 [Podila verticillata NRRL 6337]